MNAISRQLVLDWEEAISKAAKLENEITNRIDYIIKTWFEIYGVKLACWYFDGASEGEVGDLHQFIGKDSIYGFHIEVKSYSNNKDLIFINKYGDEYGWESEIPTRWLYDDKFEEEIRQGKIKYELQEKEREVKKNKSAALKKEINEKLVAQAKLKLSKEELDALKKSL